MPVKGLLSAITLKCVRPAILAFGTAAAVVLLAGAAPAQSPSGIAGVVAPGSRPNWCRKASSSPRAGQHQMARLYSPISVPVRSSSRSRRKDQPGARAGQRRQRARADARGRSAGGGGEGKRINERSRDGEVTTVTEGIAAFLSPNDVLVRPPTAAITITDPGPRPVRARTHGLRLLSAGRRQEPDRHRRSDRAAKRRRSDARWQNPHRQ